MIKREHYLKRIRGFYDSDLIKIITGIRRCGKSIILEQIMNEIKEKTDNIIYLNFEDERIISNISNCEQLLDYVDNNRKSGLCYVFFDEIKEVTDWQKACKTLRLRNTSVFITGSNSKILSKEFTKEFSGRYVSFRIRSFVYKEMIDYSKETGNDYTITDYLICGGFPKLLEFSSKEDRLVYLNDIYSSIVNKNLIVRFNIKNTELLKKITNYILMSNARIFSSRSIESYLKSEQVDGSINTIIKYVSYLEEAYIIDRIKPYSTATKKELAYYFKIYDSKEIDFVAFKDNKKYYIQVAYSVAEDKAYEREFRAFNKIDNNSKKILITNDEIDYSTSVIEHIKLKDFLLMNSLDD